MKNLAQLELIYIVEINPLSKISLLLDEIKRYFFFLNSIEYGNSDTNSIVTFSAIDSNRYQIFVRLGIQEIGGINGGISKIATIFFGNPFRSSNIISAMLTSIKFLSSLSKSFLGPMVGISGVKAIFKEEQFPLISVPIFQFSDEDICTKLVKILYSSGVSVFCDGTLSDVSIEILKKRVDFLSSITYKTKKPLFYFFNGSIEIDILIEILHFINKEKMPEYVNVGVRICPISSGLAVCSLVRKFNLPMFGYNMFHKALTNGKSFAISAGALASVFRAIGCDLINIGLLTKTVIESSIASEIIQGATCVLENSIRQSVPVFTGGLTPNTVYKTIREFGPDVILHTATPILRSGIKTKKIERNVAAIVEASELATSGLSIEYSFRNEKKSVKNWRSYNDEYSEKSE